MEYCPNIFQVDRSVRLIKKSEMNMVFELNRLKCLPMPTPLVDILNPYPIISDQAYSFWRIDWL